MITDLAAKVYNASGVTDRNDPASEESQFAVDRIRPQLTAAIKPGMRVLDIGCGAGRYTFAMEDLGAIATGIDCSIVPLEHARRIAQQRNSQAEFVPGDATAMDLPEQSFDAVMLIGNIVEYSYADMAKMMACVARILGDKGTFYVSWKDQCALCRTHEERKLQGCDPINGECKGIVTIPDKGEFEYNVWFWSAGFLTHMIKPLFTLKESEYLSDERFWLVYEKAVLGSK